MVKKSFKYCLLTFLVSLSWIACNKEDDPKTRSFYMGFTPFPYDLSVNAVNDVYDKLASEADIINHHFDNGVPWNEALNDRPFSQAIDDDWNYRKNNTDPNHKVYLSVTPIDFSRTGLAAYRAEQDNMPLPSPWNTYAMSHENVKTAYLKYCKRIIDFFDPDFFNMAIEANLLHVNSPGKWGAYLELHQYIYTQLKQAYPTLTIFTSVAGAHLLPGYIKGNDHVLERLAVLQLMEYSDLYGISFYPYLSNYLGNPYPESSFDELFSISQKPLVIAETGYAAQTFSLDVGTGMITVEADPLKQEKYTRELLEACEKWKAKFVIFFTIRDYDQLWVQLGSPTDLFIAWRDSGFYDETGSPRLARNTWMDFLSRKHHEPT